MENILERLRRGDIVVGDGALGTMLMQRGLKQGDPPEGINLTRPAVLEEIAGLYFEAGAEIITTNTFGASPLRLQHFALDKETEAINRSAVAAVRKAVGNRAYVSGSVGPSAAMIKPLGATEPQAVFDSYCRQISALVEAGVDMICVETMMDPAEAALAIQAARSVQTAIPVMATMTFDKTPQGFRTFVGASIERAAAELESAGADVIGSNCGNGMENMVAIAREFRKSTRLPVAIQGNAGLPVKQEDRLVYPETPEFVAAKAEELLQSGVQIIGGCCGTTPDHIRAIRAMVDRQKQ